MKFRALLPTFLLVLSFVSKWDVCRAESKGLDPSAAQAAFQAKNYQVVVDGLMPQLADLDRNAILILGRSNSQLKNTVAAQKVFFTGITKFPQDLEIKTFLGLEQFKAGRAKEAIVTLKEVLEKNAKFYMAYQVLVHIYEKQKNYYELRLLYQDIIAKFGERYEFISKLCERSTLDGFYDLSKKYCELGTDIAPKEPLCLIYLGITQKYTGQKELAEKSLRRAADSFSKSEFAQVSAGEYFEGEKNYIEAYKYFHRGIQANPKSVKALLGVGESGVEIQKLQEALDAYIQLCKIDKSTVAQFRKSANILRLAKNQTWLAKFEAGIEKCY
jgi:tetratricopeptide (TPR) repeat protein